MKVSEVWLREWVNPAIDVQQLATILTMAGLEVDAINTVSGSFDKVVIAQIINILPHPCADNLSLCTISIDQKLTDTPITTTLLKVVSSALNIRIGLKVALAQIGASLPGNILVKETTIEGELSQGVLCSAEELGLFGESEGILELDPDAPVGGDLYDYLYLDDRVLDINLTPNRADCLSMLGIAREVSALTKTALYPLSRSTVPLMTTIQKKIEVQVPDACPHYCGRVIENINFKATTPSWLRERLRRAGIHCIHPIVDITNYVMLELGQPMHAFDLAKLKGNIRVRFGHNDESLQLLNGQQITLQPDVLVIADEQQPLAIAGVMGGLASCIDDNTTTFFLESACFNASTIAGVARRYGLFTDSSQRFERGVDPDIHVTALERASALVLTICGGQAGPISQVGITDLTISNSLTLKAESKKTVLFNPNKVYKLTGLTIDNAIMEDMLQRLGMNITKEDALHWHVSIPSYRFDLQLDVDLIEEIIRLYGYDNIFGDNIITTIKTGRINATERLSHKLSHFFVTKGYHETISYSFVDPQLQEVLYSDLETLSLLNPISLELSQMRVGLWPGLIASMIYNSHRHQTAIKLFETGVIFTQKSGHLDEHACIAGLLTGEFGAMNWCDVNRKFDFYDLKGDLQALFASLGLTNIQFKPAQHTALHPGKSAEIVLSDEQGIDKFVGWCGVLHPRFTSIFELQDDVILFELSLSALVSTTKPRYQKISKFPQIRRDLSLLVDNDITVSQISNIIYETTNRDLLKGLDIFDLYTGQSIPAGKKSIAIALTLQNLQRTLVDTEINDVIDAIIKKLEQVFAITLRD
jgi:phenylalanyl-tRNA synthetase beta chain